MSRDGVPLLVIKRQLGHADLAITSVYLRSIDNTEIVHTVHERPAPMIPAHSRLLSKSLPTTDGFATTEQSGTPLPLSNHPSQTTSPRPTEAAESCRV